MFLLLIHIYIHTYIYFDNLRIIYIYKIYIILKFWTILINESHTCLKKQKTIVLK